VIRYRRPSRIDVTDNKETKIVTGCGFAAPIRDHTSRPWQHPILATLLSLDPQRQQPALAFFVTEHTPSQPVHRDTPDCQGALTVVAIETGHRYPTLLIP
jgi:hypothetical protein